MASSNPYELWRNIIQAGGIDAYITQELKAHGYLVKRRDTDEMRPHELDAYKKSLKAEAAEKRRLKKVAWEAYRAHHIVHLGDNVYWNDAADYDKWDLENAAVRRADNALPTLDTPQQLAEALALTVAELRWLAYHREAAKRIHYRWFTIAKRDGSARPIWAPMPKLKAVQQWILREIVEKLLMHGAAHGFVAGHSTLTNANVHVRSNILLKMDLKDFFPSITLPRVKGVFRKAGYQEQIATLLALLCTEAPREIVEYAGETYYIAMGARCLPQGAPTSPALTNALCLRLDQRLQGLADKNDWRYSRYADDLTFSAALGNDAAAPLSRLLGTITRIVNAEGFIINNKKTRVLRPSAQQKVTGFIVNGDEHAPRVPRHLKRQLRAAIHNLQQGKPLPAGETIQRLRGYAAYIAMSDPALGHQMLIALRAFE